MGAFYKLWMEVEITKSSHCQEIRGRRKRSQVSALDNKWCHHYREGSAGVGLTGKTVSSVWDTLNVMLSLGFQEAMPLSVEEVSGVF